MQTVSFWRKRVLLIEIFTMCGRLTHMCIIRHAWTKSISCVLSNQNFARNQLRYEKRFWTLCRGHWMFMVMRHECMYWTSYMFVKSTLYELNQEPRVCNLSSHTYTTRSQLSKWTHLPAKLFMKSSLTNSRDACASRLSSFVMVNTSL